jgi:hypothetical protein
MVHQYTGLDQARTLPLAHGPLAMRRPVEEASGLSDSLSEGLL